MEKGKKIFIGGNWKCNGNKSFISSYEEIVKSFEFDKDKVEVTLFPSFVHLEEVIDFPLNTSIEQNQESFQVVKQMSKQL